MKTGNSEAGAGKRQCAAAFLRLCRWLGMLLAAALFSLVLLCPVLDNEAEPAQGGARLVALFSRDATLRRTALASGVGLAVTACVFFRVPPPTRAPARKPGRPAPPTTRIVGA
jgi:hypothetical protein